MFMNTLPNGDHQSLPGNRSQVSENALVDWKRRSVQDQRDHSKDEEQFQWTQGIGSLSKGKEEISESVIKKVKNYKIGPGMAIESLSLFYYSRAKITIEGTPESVLARAWLQKHKERAE